MGFARSSALGCKARSRALSCAACLLALGCGGSAREPASAPSSGAASAPAEAPRPAATAAVPSALPLAPPPPLLVRDVGFAAPASALHDPALDVYLVSNVGGDSAARDGDGFVSRLSADGSLLELVWIGRSSGGVTLDAPTGMAIHGDSLYVVDIDHVRVFERTTGKPMGRIALPPRSRARDIAVGPTGTIYVACSGTTGTGSSVYRIDLGGPRAIDTGDHLGHPTALAAGVDGVWVANDEGQVFHLGDRGDKSDAVSLPGAALRGLLRLRSGRLLAASEAASAIFVGRPSGPFDVLASELGAVADIGYDERRARLLVPLVASNALYVQSVPGD